MREKNLPLPSPLTFAPPRPPPPPPPPPPPSHHYPYPTTQLPPRHQPARHPPNKEPHATLGCDCFQISQKLALLSVCMVDV